MRRVLVAGVGNVFLRDDAFGVEVARRLLAADPLAGVRIGDFGIRSRHLAYELYQGAYDLTILIDATPRGRAPGSLYVMEPDLASSTAPPADSSTISPETVFAALRALGGTAGRVVIVGCEPLSVREGVGLSAVVKDAVGDAVLLIRELIRRETADTLPERASTALQHTSQQV